MRRCRRRFTGRAASLPGFGRYGALADALEQGQSFYGSWRKSPSAVTTIGYLGVLAGPALMGFVAHATSLVIVFCITLALMCFVAVVSRAVP